ncbi:TetR/AcrR family transcriptional regulator [Abyssalbus ytuae]|uniref:TetR/AcrR family transcriptional regulator n=1 Tax=Abyssalbus ytuae TaxID=2926907 RepID=A0A9E6ZNV1_9FLAO|nr:TetR/AcrR family transcriptional regulator [Abyssalbus ytuae]UOB15978.1 TetR/AcrR family transcriptional regulator [Abyssalbus ytuae]
MKEKIIEKATDLFLNLGFKSVTMDDIANEMGISKKTIYQHFDNKTDLIQACTFYKFLIISQGIDGICQLNKNPIEELYEIKTFALTHLKDEKQSPHYQLQKYYPKIFNELKLKQYEKMNTCVCGNLQRGIEQGYYRKDVNVDIISKIYFNGMMDLKNTEIFPPQKYSMPLLMETYLEYHVRAIATHKGIEILNNIINK